MAQATLKILSENIQKQLKELPSNATKGKIEELLCAFLKFGIFMYSKEADCLPNTTIYNFTKNNKTAAYKILPDLGLYFSNLASNIGYAYETHDENEYYLSKICAARSGLEFFVEFFQVRLTEICSSEKFEDWYNIEAGIPSFDKQLRDKIKKTPIMLKVRIPNDIPEDHWWFCHPNDWY